MSVDGAVDGHPMIAAEHYGPLQRAHRDESGRGGSINFIWGARGAAGAERGGVWGGGVPRPLPTGEGSGEGAVPPPKKFFFNIAL